MSDFSLPLSVPFPTSLFPRPFTLSSSPTPSLPLCSPNSPNPSLSPPHLLVIPSFLLHLLSEDDGQGHSHRGFSLPAPKGVSGPALGHSEGDAQSPWVGLEEEGVRLYGQRLSEQPPHLLSTCCQRWDPVTERDTSGATQILAV